MTTKETDGAKAPLPGLKYEDLFTDNVAIEEGEWVRDIPDAPGVEIRTLGWSCAAAVARRAALLQERTPDLIEGTEEFAKAKEEDKDAHEIAVRERTKYERGLVLKELLIKDWKGLADIPFNAQNLEVICTNDSAIRARMILLNATMRCGDLRNKREEAQVKNFVAGLGINFDSPESTQT